MSGSVVFFFVCLAVVGLGVAGLWVWALLKWDRKRPAAIADLVSDPIAGPGLVYADELLPVSADEAVRLVHASMKRLHGHAITSVDAVTTGWVGSVLTNIPGRGEYQLIAAVSEAGEGQTLVRCGARPRFPYGPRGHEGARRWTAKLVAEVHLAAGSERLVRDE